jgi:hypothetical protein
MAVRKRPATKGGKQRTSHKASRLARQSKSSPFTATAARRAIKKTRSKAKLIARDTDTIGQAASRVAKSGARLATRVATHGAKVARDRLEGALQSAAEVTVSALQSVTERVQKIANK